jgi:hypothetical protein
MRPKVKLDRVLASVPSNGYVEVLQPPGSATGNDAQHMLVADLIASVDIDTFAELDALVADESLVNVSMIDTFAELDAVVADESLVNLSMIDTFAELDAIVADETLLAASSIDTLAELNAILSDATLENQALRLGFGAGLSDGSGAIYSSSIVNEGSIMKTELILDLTDLKSSTTDLDIIGVEGPDLVVNGTFAADTDWTKGADWSIAAGVATAAPGAGTVLEPAAALTVEAGATYEITYTMSGFAAGTCTVSIGGTNGTARGSDATFVERVVAGDTTNLKFTSDAAADYDIDDVIVKKVSGAFVGPFSTSEVGTLFSGEIRCLETPATGVTDIDFYWADEATGLFDTAVTDLTETVALTKGGAWSADPDDWTLFTNLPTDGQYLYVACGAAGTANTYTGGKYHIRMMGT